MKRRMCGLLALLLAVVMVIGGLPMQTDAAGSLEVYTWMPNTTVLQQYSQLSLSDADLKKNDGLDYPVALMDMSRADIPDSKVIIGWKLWKANSATGSLYAGQLLKEYEEADATVSSGDVADGYYRLIAEAVFGDRLMGSLSVKRADVVTDVIHYLDNVTAEATVTSPANANLSYTWYQATEGADSLIASEIGNTQNMLVSMLPGSIIWCEVKSDNAVGTIETAKYTVEKAVLQGEVTLTGEAVFGETLSASMALNGNMAGRNMNLQYTFKRGDAVVQAASANNTYTLTAADVGQKITVEVSSAYASNVLTKESAQVQKAGLEITGAVVSGRAYDGTTAANVESVSFRKAGSARSNGQLPLTKGVDYRIVSANYNSAAAGTDKTVEIKVELMGDIAKEYTLVNDTYTVYNQTITGVTNSVIDDDEDDEDDEWDDLLDDLRNARDGQTITVNLGDNTVVPGDIFDCIKGRDVTIILDLGNGLSWTINGRNVTSDNVPDIDFGVTLGGENTIPIDVLNVVTGERYHLNVSLAYSGEFGLVAILNVDLNKKNKGLYANLFYYNEAYNVMQFMNADMIDENGVAHLIFTHASEYSIVIDKVVMGTSALSPKTGEETGALPYVLVIAALAGIYFGVELLIKVRKEQS